MNLRRAIQLLQDTAKSSHMQIIIVGGAMVRLIGPQTAIKQINTEKQTILLDKALNPDVSREEDKKTIVDIDCIAFSSEKDPFNRNVRHDFEKLRSEIKKLQKEYPDFPAISMEPVLYHPYFMKPHTLSQFVSSIESYHKDSFFFRLGGIKVDVQKKSVEPWTYAFTDSQET
ncbi:MAG: hypothetical protein KGJ07_09875, partial [Patescibacteria group bacterium]|nr:hypothetical protein [Patescibacteria group bacterium]